MAAVLKTVILKGIGGSNPSSSANGVLVQLVRMPPCHGGGHGFESHTHRKTFYDEGTRLGTGSEGGNTHKMFIGPIAQSVRAPHS